MPKSKLVVRVGIGNAMPPSDECFSSSEMIRIWETVGAYFQDYPLAIPSRGSSQDMLSARLSVDPSDTIEFIHLCPLDQDLESLRRRWRNGDITGYSSFIECEVAGELPAGTSADMLVARFLQQLFLGMNLALPGSCNLFRPVVAGASLPGTEMPHLPADLFDHAAWVAKEWGWPTIQRLPFEAVWAWVHSRLWIADSVTGPLEKAAFTFLELAPRDRVDTGSVMLLAQALESLFVTESQGVGALLRDRIAVLLGGPPTHQNWVTKFYDLRSRVAHGAAALWRPGEYHFSDEPLARMLEERDILVARAAAVLLATMQDMILNAAAELRFSQQLTPVPYVD